MKKFFGDGKKYMQRRESKQSKIQYKNHNQKRIYLDLADAERRSDMSPSSLKGIKGEGSPNGWKTHRMMPTSTKLIFKRDNKLYDSTEYECDLPKSK